MSRPEQVDVLVSHGLVVTADEGDSVIRDGAVAVRGDRIVAVGPTTEVTASHRAAFVLDAAGGVVMPGMVNAHTHLAMTLLRGVADDLDLQGFLDRVWERERKVVSPEAVRLGVTAGIVESLASGVTVAADMYFHPRDALVVSEELGFRLVTGPAFFDFEMPWYRGFDVELGAAREWLGEAPGLALRRAVAAHSTYTLEPGRLAVVAELAAAHGAALQVHASENEAEVATVRERHGGTPIEVLDQAGALGPSTILAHAVVLTDHDHELIANSGAGVAHNPASNLKLNSGIAPVPRLRGDGVPVGLGTDGPASSNSLDLFTAMRLAALVHKAAADDLTVLPAVDIVRMATIEGARVLGLDHELGSLEAGKLADLVVLDAGRVTGTPGQDPASTLAYATGARDVRAVFVSGRQVVANGEVVTVDEGEVAAAVRSLMGAV